MKTGDRHIRVWLWLLACVLVFIWGNSLLPGEDPPSGAGGGLLRKAAHFTEFTVLGLVLCRLSGLLKKKIYVPILLGVAAACIDETIQMFVPGRGPALRDVLIDSCGVLSGVFLLRLGYAVCKKK